MVEETKPSEEEEEAKKELATLEEEKKELNSQIDALKETKKALEKLEYSAKKDIEYNGEATSVTVYWDVNEFLSKGTYRVSVFADGHNIGNASFNYEK